MSAFSPSFCLSIKGECRPSLVEETAYLARLCIEIDLISEAVSVKRGCLPKNSELKEEGRSDLAMASLGP